MLKGKKSIIFLVVLLVNAAVILSFIFLTKRIRTDENLRVSPTRSSH